EIALHRHVACHRYAVTELKGTRCLTVTTNRIQEVLHVCSWHCGCLSHQFRSGWTVYFLRNIADLLSSRGSAVGAKDVLGHTQIVVAKSCIPGKQNLFRKL